MFFRFVTLIPIAALIAVVTAAPDVLKARNGPDCASGDEYCCSQKLGSGQTPFHGVLGGLITAVVGANLDAAFTCNTIAALGVTTGAQCTTQAACCTGTQQVGLVNAECVPASVNA